MTNSKKVFITGGTGSIGRTLVEAFCDGGYDVTFQYGHEKAKAVDISKALNAKAWQADFSDMEFSLPDADFDIVINCAGVSFKALAIEIEDSEWDRMLAVNVTAPFKIMKKYLPGMMNNQWGRIINIGSIWSVRATELNTAYTVSKHALSGLTKSITREYAKYGITCNELCLGPIETESLHTISKNPKVRGDLTPEQYLDKLRARIPSGNLTQPVDIANAALFLSSESSKSINGQSIVIDGGQITGY